MQSYIIFTIYTSLQSNFILAFFYISAYQLFYIIGFQAQMEMQWTVFQGDREGKQPVR